MNTKNILPYTIHANHSERFYRNLSEVSSAMQVLARGKIKDVIQAKRHCKKTYETQETLLIEILTIGTLWNNYIAKAIQVPDKLMTEIEKLRELTIRFPEHLNYKDACLALRSKMLTPGKNLTSESLQFSLKTFDALIRWLKATNEHTYEVQVFEDWRRYWKAKDGLKFTDDLCNILSFTHAVFAACYKHLGFIFDDRYFSILIPRLNPKREDYFQVAKPKEEYFLNFLAAEIMNMQAEKAHDTGEKKTVFAPGCMRINNGRGCRAINDSGHLKCIGCNPDCNVQKLIHESGNGFEVYLTLHQSAFKAGCPGIKSSRVVGIACAGCLLAGGLMLKSRGIEASCLILNMPGCKKHWTMQGEPTAISRYKLNELLFSKLPSLHIQ